MPTVLLTRVGRWGLLIMKLLDANKPAFQKPTIRSHHYKGIPGEKPGFAFVATTWPSYDIRGWLEDYVTWALYRT